MKRVTIYTKPGCHLCDEAIEVMRSAGCEENYTLEEMNIETDAELLERYQYDVPVITVDGVEAFRHRLTAAAFRALILPQT
jgi:glutaredoxin